LQELGIMGVRGTAMTNPDIALANERIDGYIDKRGPDDCWLWTDAQNGDGYGWIRVGGKKYLFDRLAQMVATGTNPDKRGVRQSCNNPACCNPAHLRAGTERENADDIHRSQRGA
jgi:hypothetical protein